MPAAKDTARLRSHPRVVPPTFHGVAHRAADLSQITLTDEFRHALDLIERQGQSLFLTGKAGTGKSTFLHYLRETTTKATVVLAPTGVAALNVGGQTIHSFFQLPPTIIDPQSLRRRKNPKLFQKLQTLIIDEVSMVRADVMDAVDRALRVQRDNLSTPFGGVQVVLCGDLFQLPPIVRDGDMRTFFDAQYGGPYFRGRIAPRGAARAQGPRRSLKKSADCSAIPLRSEPPEVICPARLEGEGSRGQQSEVRAARLTAQRRRDAG